MTVDPDSVETYIVLNDEKEAKNVLWLEKASQCKVGVWDGFKTQWTTSGRLKPSILLPPTRKFYLAIA